MMMPRAWMQRQNNTTYFLVAFVANALIFLCTVFLMFGGPLTRHLPGMFGGSLALAYVMMLGRPPRA